MLKLMQSTWMVLLLGTLLYLGTTVLLWKTPEPAPDPANSLTEGAQVNGPSWEFKNPDMDLLILELGKEKEDLAKEKQTLAALAQHLALEKQEVEKLMQKVDQAQRDFDAVVTRVQEEEVSKLKKLAKTYAAMDPTGAAAIFSKMDDHQVAKILMHMKESEVAPILETIARKGDAEAKRIADLTDKLRLTLAPKPATNP